MTIKPNPAIPEGYCQCGCGGLTTPRRDTNTAKGYAKGQPHSFINGHANPRLRHGQAMKSGATSTYTVWSSMLQRCNDPNASTYYKYGAKGVTVCERWLSFDNFFEDMGERPEGKSIDRIDTFGDYTPENCKWSTPKEQTRNKRNNLYVTYQDETLLLIEWAERLGMKYHTIRSRIVDRGWSIEKAITTPVQVHNA